MLHVGSPRTAVNFEQRRYSGVDENGNQIGPNPTYGQATSYLAPMAVRLGLEVDF